MRLQNFDLRESKNDYLIRTPTPYPLSLQKIKYASSKPLSIGNLLIFLVNIDIDFFLL